MLDQYGENTILGNKDPNSMINLENLSGLVPEKHTWQQECIPVIITVF